MWELTSTTLSSLQMLGLAFVLCAIIGAEREYNHKDAGLRTHILVGLGSALFTVISAYGFADLAGDPPADPGRIAAQVVTGIGFLGAGVIFMRSNVVHGLTTAATIWIAAAVGMACGAGLPLLAIAVTAVSVVVIPLLGRLMARVPGVHRDQTLRIRYRDGAGVLRTVLRTAADLGLRTVLLSSEHTASGTVEVVARFAGRARQTDLVATLSELDGVQRVEPSSWTGR